MEYINRDKMKILFFLVVILLFDFSAASQSSKSANYFPKAEWRTASPHSQGFDEKQLDRFINELKEGKILKPVSSVTIIKNGYLVLHETFGNYNSDQPHTLQSVTKSITSTLVGVAIQNGFIEDLDQKVLYFFPESSQMHPLPRETHLH